jgi:hypothetical protein
MDSDVAQPHLAMDAAPVCDVLEDGGPVLVQADVVAQREVEDPSRAA